VHCGEKISKYISPCSPLIFSPFDIISNISSNLSSIPSPSFLLYHHFSLTNNALPTSRRLRHQNHIPVSDVAPCFFCGIDQDSFSHIYSDCVVVSNARSLLFRQLDLDLSPFTHIVPSTPLPKPHVSSPSVSLLPSVPPHPNVLLSPSRSISTSCPFLPRSHSFPRLVHFLSSLIQRSTSSVPPLPPTTSSIYPLAAATVGASLGPTFLFGVPETLLRPILAFNFAVWSYRKPALASSPVQGPHWLVSRIVERATGLLSCFKSKIRKSASPVLPDEDPSIINHRALTSSSESNVVFCYTDGSAFPNPGPSGAGVSMFLQNPDEVLDAGVSIGFSTNNAAELVALLICFVELLRLSELRHFVTAFIFCDSSYAIYQATSSKLPGSNRDLIKRLRTVHSKAIAAFNVKLLWIRGHSVAGGNNRVDRLSRTFASLNPPQPAPFDTSRLSSYSSSSSSWPFGFPLASVPFNCFFSSLPPAPGLIYALPIYPDSFVPRSVNVSCVTGGRSSLRLKDLHQKSNLQCNQSKKLKTHAESLLGSAFYDTETESLDFKHSDDTCLTTPVLVLGVSLTKGVPPGTLLNASVSSTFPVPRRSKRLACNVLS